MKTYPKIPRYDHKVVDDQLYDSEDLIILEKTDGQNSRIFLYDSRFSKYYTDDINKFNPTDGDVFIGTKKAIQGKLSDDLQEFKGNFHRLINYLRDNLDTKELRSLHTKYDSPLVLFGEHMIHHTVNYDYKKSPPPVFLGFDVFPQVKYTSETPDNPYNETFDRFLDFSEVKQIFKRVNLPVINQLDEFEPPINPENVTIPSSDYAEIQAEGVVFRSDSLSTRSKKVSPEFKETMKKYWGLREDQAETGDELIIAWFMTNGRIRKGINKQINNHGEIDIDLLAESLVKDVWIEEWQEISTLDLELTPQEIYGYTIERCTALLDRMESNAQLNNASLDELWEPNTDTDPKIEHSFEITDEEISSIEEKVKEYDQIEKGLVYELLEPGTILNLAKSIADKENKELDRWVIPEVRDELYELYWVNNLEVLANLSISYTPQKINDILLDTIVESITKFVESDEVKEHQINTFSGNVLNES